MGSLGNNKSVLCKPYKRCVARHGNAPWASRTVVAMLRIIAIVAMVQGIHATPAWADNHASKSFVAASSNNFPPVNMLDDNGELIGFGRDIARAVIAAVGGELKSVHSSNWKEVVGWLDSGAADFIHDTGYTKDREKIFDYTDPILAMHEEIYVRPDEFGIATLESLFGKTVACVERHISHRYLIKYPDITCRVVGTPAEGLFLLVNGDVDAFVYPREVMLSLSQNLRLTDKFKATGDPLRELVWHMTVRKGNADMRALLNTGIQAIKASGEYGQIYERWFGRQFLAAYSDREIWLLSGATIIISLILGGFFIATIYGLRQRQIKKTLRATIKELHIARDDLFATETEVRAILDNMAETFYRADNDGRVIMVSRSSGDLLGRPPEEMIGTYLIDLYVDPRRREEFLDQMRANDGVLNNFESTLLHKDGHLVHVATSARYWHDKNGVAQGTEGIVRDITVLKHAETALVTEKLLAERSNKAKSDFLAHMSHELRTPLNAIIGFSQMIGGEMLGPVKPTKYRDYALDIEKSGGFLLHLIQEILDLSKIEAGKATFQDQDVAVDTFLDFVDSTFSNQAKQASITLTTQRPDKPVSIRCDPVRMKQVLANLVANSLKFTEEGNSINVVARIGKKRGLEFCVTDTGIGIPKGDQVGILEPFGQSRQDVTRTHEGAGLGLSIARLIMERHDGTLVLESTPGKGTTVTATLPAKRIVRT